jgi:hypothetical protein
MTGRIGCSSGLTWYQLPASSHFREAKVIPDPLITENCGEAAPDQLVGFIGGLLEVDAVFVTTRALPAIIRAGQAGWTATAFVSTEDRR